MQQLQYDQLPKKDQKTWDSVLHSYDKQQKFVYKNVKGSFTNSKWTNHQVKDTKTKN